MRQIASITTLALISTLLTSCTFLESLFDELPAFSNKIEHKIVELDDCNDLAKEIASQTEPTRYKLGRDCTFDQGTLPLAIDKDNTIIDGNHNTIKSPSYSGRLPNGFVLSGENIILANIKMTDFTAPVHALPGTSAVLYNTELFDSQHAAVIFGKHDPESFPARPIRRFTPIIDAISSLEVDIITAAHADPETCDTVEYIIEDGETPSDFLTPEGLSICGLVIEGVTDLPGTAILVNGGTLHITSTLNISEVRHGIYMNDGNGSIILENPVAPATSTVVEITEASETAFAMDGGSLNLQQETKMKFDGSSIVDFCIPDRLDDDGEKIRGVTFNGSIETTALPAVGEEPEIIKVCPTSCENYKSDECYSY